MVGLRGHEPEFPRFLQVLHVRRRDAEPTARLRWAPSSSACMTVVLPIGISFYTFHSLTYIIDLYRGHATPAKSFTDFSAFVALFPDLVAGPDHPLQDPGRATGGARAHGARGSPPASPSSCSGSPRRSCWPTRRARGRRGVQRRRIRARFDAWVGVLAYAFQIYFDFCGYSDMAVGLGRMLGLRVPEELRRAVPRGKHHRGLAALAHLAVERAARLPLLPAGRQPQGDGGPTSISPW